MSENNIGDAALVHLENIILGNESIVCIYFDNNGIQSATALIQFFSSLHRSSHLLHLSKPKNDMKMLIQNSPDSEKSLNEAWYSLVKKMKKNSEGFENNSQEYFDLNSAMFSDSQPLIESIDSPVVN